MTNKSKNNIGFFQFLGIVKWVIRFCFQLAPFETGMFFVLKAVSDLDKIVNPYIFAKLLDSVIKLVGKTDSLKSIIPWLIALFAYNMLVSLMRSFMSFYRNNIRLINNWKTEQKLYEKVNTLGIQTQENSNLRITCKEEKKQWGMSVITWKEYLIFIKHNYLDNLCLDYF